MQYYFVILWGIADCDFQGPFSDLDAAQSWIDDLFIRG